MKLTPIICTRQKRGNPLYSHYGVVFASAPYPFDLDTVVEFGTNGPKLIYFADFGKGYRVTLNRDIIADSHELASARANQVLQNPAEYHAAERNCEHVARWIVTGRWESGQVARTLFLGGAALTVGLLALLPRDQGSQPKTPRPRPKKRSRGISRK